MDLTVILKNFSLGTYTRKKILYKYYNPKYIILKEIKILSKENRKKSINEKLRGNYQ
jgi:hypothetical protein